jgi:hypothetical protein
MTNGNVRRFLFRQLAGGGAGLQGLPKSQPGVSGLSTIQTY